MKGYSMNAKIIVVIFGLVFLIPIYAQSQISLLDTERVKDYLAFSSKQSEKIIPQIELIKNILEEDKKILADLRERFSSGDEPGFFEKINVKRSRNARINQIEELLESIVDNLNDPQKIKYKDIKKPALKSLNKKELTE